MSDWLNRCHFGDCRDTMRRMIADGVRVQCIVTSPPYWGLRDYGVVGQIGLEPTLPEFLAQLVEVFDLCRQLLTDDGTLWLNMGDSYAGSRCGPDKSSPLRSSRDNMTEAMRAKAAMVASRRRDDHPIPRSDVHVAGLKPKDLVGQPWRLAFALQGFAVIDGASMAQWADWLAEARVVGDWEMVQMVEDRIRAESALSALRDAGWWLRQDIIWSKPNPMPESVRDRCTKAHEYLFLLSKSERYFFDFDANKESAVSATCAVPAGWDTGAGAHRDLKGRYSGTGVGFGHGYDANPKPRSRRDSFKREDSKREQAIPGQSVGTHRPERAESEWDVSRRNRRSVWTIPTQAYSGAHFATFPEALVEPCVLAGSRPGDIVFDPFFGTGTVGRVALRFGRQFIGCELNPDNLALQNDRLRGVTAGLPLGACA
jgi:site-specific DNA-methyltransferase (cytosine-N4-specific)